MSNRTDSEHRFPPTAQGTSRRSTSRTPAASSSNSRPAPKRTQQDADNSDPSSELTPNSNHSTPQKKRRVSNDSTGTTASKGRKEKGKEKAVDQDSVPKKGGRRRAERESDDEEEEDEEKDEEEADSSEEEARGDDWLTDENYKSKGGDSLGGFEPGEGEEGREEQEGEDDEGSGASGDAGVGEKIVTRGIVGGFGGSLDHESAIEACEALDIDEDHPDRDSMIEFFRADYHERSALSYKSQLETNGYLKKLLGLTKENWKPTPEFGKVVGDLARLVLFCGHFVAPKDATEFNNSLMKPLMRRIKTLPGSNLPQEWVTDESLKKAVATLCRDKLNDARKRFVELVDKEGRLNLNELIDKFCGSPNFTIKMACIAAFYVSVIKKLLKGGEKGGNSKEKTKKKKPSPSDCWLSIFKELKVLETKYRNAVKDIEDPKEKEAAMQKFANEFRADYYDKKSTISKGHKWAKTSNRTSNVALLQEYVTKFGVAFLSLEA